MKVELAAYAAGIIDGEGSFSITKDRNKGRTFARGGLAYYYASMITVAMRDQKVINFLHENFGGWAYSYGTAYGYRVYRWQIGNNKAGEFCKLIVPYLVTKRRQAELIIEFQCRPRGDKHGEQYQILVVAANAENSIHAARHLEKLEAQN